MSLGLCRYVEAGQVCIRSNDHAGRHVLAVDTRTADERFLDLTALHPVDPTLIGRIVAHADDALPLGHHFIGVRAHPDDDECTFRADGTDATYCGETEASHYRVAGGEQA